jgi:hypothetical protein
MSWNKCETNNEPLTSVLASLQSTEEEGKQTSYFIVSREQWIKAMGIICDCANVYLWTMELCLALSQWGDMG